MRGKNFYFLPLFFCESENRWNYFLRIFLILEVGKTFIPRTQKCFSLREPPVFRTFRKWSSITVCSLQHTTEYEYAMFCTHPPPPAEYVLFLLIIIIHSENLKINQFTLNTVVHILYSTLTLHCRFFSSSNLPELDFETSCTLAWLWDVMHAEWFRLCNVMLTARLRLCDVMQTAWVWLCNVMHTVWVRLYDVIIVIHTVLPN